MSASTTRNLPLNKHKPGDIVKFAAGLLALAVTFGLILVLQSFYEQTISSLATHQESPLPSVQAHAHQRPALVPWTQSLSNIDSESNVLELPKASFDFVGNWGGYTHDIGSSEIEGPDHVSVVFGKRDDTVFFATLLYSPSDQKILSKPKARITNPTEVLVTYKGEDEQLDYIYLHQFKLLDSGKIAYNETVNFYDRRTHSYVGTFGQRAVLRRLTTASEERVFARPPSRDVFKGKLSTSKTIHTR
jgi:hypothetical protein